MDFKRVLRTVWLLLLLVISTSLSAQTRVTGTVYESDGKTPMVGATIMQKGTSNGTATDIDGKFSLKVTGKNPVLVFQSVGYTKQEVAAKGKTEFTITMKESATMLNDVVVTASVSPASRNRWVMPCRRWAATRSIRPHQATGSTL